ncbi:MAG: hypothetical protein E7Z89_05160 [Cyanobacteria bacterium SIG28]|nr:hypothetical protein [Cyanobacteria bacterium SIG28]
MFKLIKITFKATILVLALIGFNAIGGQKYVEMAKTSIVKFIHERAENRAQSIGNFSNLHEEFEIDNTVNLFGYKAVLAEHNVSGQKLCIVDSGKKALLTQDDIKSKDLETKMQKLADKFKFQSVSFHEIKVINRGTITVYGQTVPYAKFEAKANKLPFSDLSGIVASVKTSDGSEKLAIAISEKKKYSQLITDEFYKNVKEN